MADGMSFELSEDQELIRKSVAELAGRFDDHYWMEKDEAHEFPREFYDAIAGGGSNKFDGSLSGYEETPSTLSTPAIGSFDARLSKDGTTLTYELSYSGLEGNVTQAHVHFGQRALSGGISYWKLSSPLPEYQPPVEEASCCSMTSLRYRRLVEPEAAILTSRSSASASPFSAVT